MKMKKFYSLLILGLSTAIALSAQEYDPTAHKLHLLVQGGPSVSFGENYFSYDSNKKSFYLVSAQFSGGIMYDFTPRFSMRFSAGMGGNAGAKNTEETEDHDFYPYHYMNVSAFADFIFDPRGEHPRITAFKPYVYVGVGYAYTFGFHFTNSSYHWQVVTDPNHALGIRAGIMPVYYFNKFIGMYADLCLEAYTDSYNGLKPSEEDKTQTAGYPGFPFDMRPELSLGLLINF